MRNFPVAQPQSVMVSAGWRMKWRGRTFLYSTFLCLMPAVVVISIIAIEREDECACLILAK